MLCAENAFTDPSFFAFDAYPKSFVLLILFPTVTVEIIAVKIVEFLKAIRESFFCKARNSLKTAFFPRR